MIKPFHLSFVVPNKNESKRFYLDVLNCTLGRDNETWFDIIFYGHQITIHQETDGMPAYKIDHFGPILTKEDWQLAYERLNSSGVKFVADPLIKNKGANDESGKFLIVDPSGNILEFKYYLSFETSLA